MRDENQGQRRRPAHAFGRQANAEQARASDVDRRLDLLEAPPVPRRTQRRPGAPCGSRRQRGALGRGGGLHQLLPPSGRPHRLCCRPTGASFVAEPKPAEPIRKPPKKKMGRSSGVGGHPPKIIAEGGRSARPPTHAGANGGRPDRLTQKEAPSDRWDRLAGFAAAADRNGQREQPTPGSHTAKGVARGGLSAALPSFERGSTSAGRRPGPSDRPTNHQRASEGALACGLRSLPLAKRTIRSPEQAA